MSRTIIDSNIAPGQVFRNRLINGDMRIDQRNASATLTVDSPSAFYSVDRWVATGQTADGVFTIRKNNSGLDAFPDAITVTVTTADASIGASQSYFMRQRIEGYNVADLMFGTSLAKPVTISFWVKSTVAGTFSGSLRNEDASHRAYVFTYTINVTNTWEYKTVTISGDTTGVWPKTSGLGLSLSFDFGCGTNFENTAGSWVAFNRLKSTGSVSLISTLNANWNITGVQFELGTVATPFEYRPYAQELYMCQRYYQKSYQPQFVPGTSAKSEGSHWWTDPVAAGITSIKFHAPFRDAPTVTGYSGVSGVAGNYRDSTSGTDFAISAIDLIGDMTARVAVTTSGAAGENKSFQWAAAAEI